MRPRLPLILALFLTIAIPQAGHTAIQCTLASSSCTSTGSVSTGNGFSIGNLCLTEQTVYDCFDTNPLDECAPMEAASSCTELSRTCLLSQNGSCLREEVTYECMNDLTDYAPARLIDTRFANYDATDNSNCQAFEANPSCTRASETCVTPTATQTIMGTSVSRQCWDWQRTYLCDNGGMVNNCAAFEQDSNCFESSSTCLVPGQGGSCTHVSAEFTCGSNAPSNGQCQATQVCIGTLCDGIPDPPDNQFATAMQWLNWMNDTIADKTIDPTQTTFDMFQGQARGCRVGILGTLNCCKDYGWALGWLAQCNASEVALMAAQDAGATHYIGSYCSQRLIICAQTVHVYCAFNSALGRVFQEQVRAQLGLGWGTPQSPRCGALTFAQLQGVDFTSIDLSAAFPYLTATTQPNAAQLTQSLMQKFQQMTGQVDATFQ